MFLFLSLTKLASVASFQDDDTKGARYNWQGEIFDLYLKFYNFIISKNVDYLDFAAAARDFGINQELFPDFNSYAAYAGYANNALHYADEVKERVLAFNLDPKVVQEVNKRN